MVETRVKYDNEDQLIIDYLQGFSEELFPLDEREFHSSIYDKVMGKAFHRYPFADKPGLFGDWRTIHSGGEKYRVSERLGSLIDGLVGRGLVKRVGKYGIKPTQGENCLTLRE